MKEHYQIKPWGWEDLIVECDNYRVKLIHIEKGLRTSLHYHKQKEETLWKLPFFIERFIHVPPNTPHILDEGDWFEVSTGPDFDSIRIKDDLGRKLG